MCRGGYLLDDGPRPGETRDMRVLLLHALALTGDMWADQLAWLPGSAMAPTLYGCGPSITDWAAGVLREVGEELVVDVGASVGEFCALEMARLARGQVGAAVLVGSKAGVRRDDGARDCVFSLIARQAST